MRVRATQDGHYGGYFRVGPIQDDQKPFAGEVFDIEDKPFPILDIDGKPVFELDEKGKKVIDQATGKPKMKMGTWFSPVWMEQVSEDEMVTFDHPPFELPVQYRAIKVRKNQPAKGGVPTPSAVI